MADRMESEREVICRKATVTDVLTLFFVNYLTHAITVLISPGYSLAAAGDAALWSLLVPYKSIYHALRITARLAWFGRDPLQRARRAGALCCVYKEIRDREGKIAYTFDDELESMCSVRLSLDLSCFPTSPDNWPLLTRENWMQVSRSPLFRCPKPEQRCMDLSGSHKATN